MQLGDGRVDADALLERCARTAASTHVFDMAAVAREAGTVDQRGACSARSPRAACCRSRARRCEAMIARRRQGRRREPARLREGVRHRRATRRAARGRAAAAPRRRGAPRSAAPTRRVAPELRASARVPTFPADDARDRSRSATRASLDYQDARYAELYLRAPGARPRRRARRRPGRRARLRDDARDGALPRALDGVRRHRPRRRPEVPRARAARACAREVKAGDGECCASTITSSPASPSSPALLPRALADRADRAGTAPRRARPSSRSRCRSRSAPHTRARLRCALRAARRAASGCAAHGSRFAAEQALIERWLDGVVARRAPTTGARPRDRRVRPADQGLRRTNERGKENLLHVLDHLAVASRCAQRRRARRGDPRGARRRARRRGRHGARRGAGCATARRRGRSRRSRSAGCASRPPAGRRARGARLTLRSRQAPITTPRRPTMRMQGRSPSRGARAALRSPHRRAFNTTRRP